MAMCCRNRLAALIFTCLFILLLAPPNRCEEKPSRPVAPEGSPFRGLQDALLRGDRDEARRLLHALPAVDPDMPDSRGRIARISLFEALLEPPPRRMDALLSAARSFPHQEEGLTALTACLHLLEQSSREDRDRFSKKEIDSKEEAFLACTSLIESWKKRAADDPRVRLAEVLLLESRKNLVTCGAARLGAVVYLQSPLHIDEIPVPGPLKEEVRVTHHDLFDSPGEALIHNREAEYLRETLTPFIQGDPEREPVDEELYEPDRIEQDLLPQVPGTYLMDVESVRRGWSRMEVLVVSDLDLTTQAGADGFALLATLNGQPAPGVEIRGILSPGAKEKEIAIGRTDENGLLLAPFPERMNSGSLLLLGRKGDHRKTVRLSRAAPLDDTPELKAHLFCDRSIYRPGETVSGRILVRRHEAAKPLQGLFGSSVDSEPVSTPLADREVVLEISGTKKWKQRLNLRTDSLGAACFTITLPLAVPLGPVRVEAWVPVKWRSEFRNTVSNNRERKPHASLRTWRAVFDVQEYKRPPLLWDVAWPEGWQSKETAPEVLITARYPTGSPACGLKGSFTARLDGVEQTVPFVLDSRGEAKVIVAVDELDLPGGKVRVRCRAAIAAADGQTLTRESNIDLVPGSWLATESSNQASASNKPRRNRNTDRNEKLRLSIPRGRWPSGKDVPVSLSGPPGAPVLFTIGRAGLLDARVVTLDGAGEAELLLPTSGAWCPRVYLSAAMPASSCRERRSRTYFGNDTGRNNDVYLDLFDSAHLNLDEPPGRLEVSLEKNAEEYGPGDEACWTVVTRDAKGNAVPATVAVSVLDERLALLMDDSLKDAGRALAPYWWWGRTIYRRGPMHILPRDLFDTLIRDGKVVSPFEKVERGSARAWAGGASAGLGNRSRPRVSFRKTAFFDGSILTGSDGRGEIRFTFPDDLTTWRVILVAVDKGRQAALLEEKVATRRDPAVTPLLPRMLREGDRIAVPTLVQSTKNGLPAGGGVAFFSEGSLEIEAGDPGSPFPAAPGRSLVRTARLHGKSEGDGLFRALLHDASGDRLDQIDLELPVHTRNICRRLSSVVAIGREAVLEPPVLDGLKPARLHLEVAGSLDAFIGKARTYLDRYPYGCAEQLSSCMTPALIALHPDLGRSFGGAPSPQRTRRLETGMNRLRRYQNSDGGFTWWGSGGTDPVISACVLRFLAFMKEAGLRPGDYGIRLDPEAYLFVRAAGRIDELLSEPLADSRKERRAQIGHAEIAVCRLLLFPDLAGAGDDCLKLVPILPDLPTGLVARLGKALVLVGEKEGAETAAAHLRTRIEGNLLGQPSFDILVESPASQLAAALDFFLAVCPDDPLRPRLVSELLARFDGDCFDHTFGTAAALVALSRELAEFPFEAEGDSCLVQVEGSGFTEELELDAAGGWRAECTFPSGPGRVKVTNRSGPGLLAVLTAEFVEDGAAALPLARPIAVSRKLFRLLPDETGALTRREEAGAIRAGEVVEAVVTVQAPDRMRYLVVDCPVPAGFEVIRGKQRVEVRDDRAVFCLRTSEEFSRSLRFRAALEGRVAWPPVQAADMYDRKCWGRSAGCRIDVGPASVQKEAGQPVRVLTRRRMESQLASIRKRLARAERARDKADILRELKAFPLADQKEWCFHDALRLVGERLDDPDLAGAYVRILGFKARDRFRAERLDEVMASVGERGDAAFISLARALDESSHGSWALGLLKEKSALTPNELRLFTLTVFFDDLYLHDDDPVAFFRRCSSMYADVPEELRVEAVMSRLDEFEQSIYHSDERRAARLLSEMAGTVFWAWDRTDLAGKASLASELQDCCDNLQSKNDPRGRSSKRPPAGSSQRMILSRLEERISAAILDGLDRLGEPGLDSPKKPWSPLSSLFEQALSGGKKKDVNRLLEEAVSRIKRIRGIAGKEEEFLTAAGRFLEILLEQKPAVKEARFLDALALPVFYCTMVPEARSEAECSVSSEDCWNLLSGQAQTSVSGSTLLSVVMNEEEEWAAVELLERGGADEEALLLALPRIDDNYVRQAVLDKVSLDRLCSLPLSCAISLVVEEERWWGGKEGRLWKKLRQTVAKGELKSEKIAEMLARSRNPDLRFLLVQILAVRGWSKAAFSSDDPAAPFYSSLLSARLGDAAAVEELRAMALDRERSFDDLEIYDILWALEPSLGLEDMIRLHEARPDLRCPSLLARPLLSRERPDRIVALLQRSDLKGDFVDDMADSLAAKTIRAIGPALLDLDLQGKEFVSRDRFFPILVEDERTRRKILSSAPELSYSMALDLLYARHDNPLIRIALASCFLTSREEDIQDSAMRSLKSRLGDPGAWLPGGPGGVEERDASLKTVIGLHGMIHRQGITAVEEALKSPDPILCGAARTLLARYGLDLSAPVAR